MRAFLNIITESLYDKPIVIFREYIQNSADAFAKAICLSPICKIWHEGNSLFFLDNGTGIEEDEFHEKMINIASSTKSKKANIGYKGIGRLSGIPYCKKLHFINIISYSQSIFKNIT